MAVYDRILVPLDGSSVDDTVLDHVAALGAALGAEIVLLRVAHFHTRDEMAHEVDDAQVCLDKAEKRLAGRGLKVRTVVGRGEPVATIVEQAINVGADLIAMATHGHSWLPRKLYGSVAEGVRHATAVPLLLVKAPVADENGG
jgi:nucleotide-binding universal stress UspA family protein